MKTIYCILAVCLLSLGGCVSGKIDAQVVVNHDFLAPNDIPGCTATVCPTPSPVVTVNLPPVTQNIHFKLPNGAAASSYIEEMDLLSISGYPLDFIQEVTVEVSASGIATYPLVDYKPSVPPTTAIYLFPDDVDLTPYLEAPQTTFTIAVTGTVPSEDVPLHVDITIDAEATYYSKGL
jgi:hypothetical protein